LYFYTQFNESFVDNEQVFSQTDVSSKRRKTNQTSNKQPKNGRQFLCNLTQTDLIFPTLKPTPMGLKFSPPHILKIILASRTLAHLQNRTSQHTNQVLQKSQFSTLKKIYWTNISTIQKKYLSLHR
jgi:hypothetical protein